MRKKRVTSCAKVPGESFRPLATKPNADKNGRLRTERTVQKQTNRPPVNKLAYRIDEAEIVSGLGRSSIYELISDGRLSSVKIGGRRLILHEDLEALLLSGKTAVARPTPPSPPNAVSTREEGSTCFAGDSSWPRKQHRSFGTVPRPSGKMS
jgi:excisionase family DNA binding protein